MNKNFKKSAMVRCAVVTLLYLLFLLWVGSLWGLLVVPFILDAYLTKVIPWTWWKKLKNPTLRTVMSWVDAIVFALVAVAFVNIFAFQNYVIPSASLEKSLLTGDYLLVSKLSYGPRIPQTPLAMPLTQHTLPIVNCKSYLEWPQWAYRRVKGLGSVQLNDIVVFNYPAGDTVVANAAYQAADFYGLCYQLGQQICANAPRLEELPEEQQRMVLAIYQQEGRKYIEEHPEEFGEILARPVDRRENYVKRCVGMPGQTLQIKNRIVYLDGVANKEPDEVQYMYTLKTTRPLSEELCHELGISLEDASTHNAEETLYYLPLTQRAKAALEAKGDLVVSITQEQSQPDALYPLEVYTGWTRDDYGPLWIPKKGETLTLTTENLPFYRRPIAVYEGNQLEVKNGKIFINGVETDRYTFRMDYYWMMGDNRHNSADSRYWGFVPEDHIVGKPIVVWLSLDKDRGWLNGKIRWNRFFKWVDNIK
jgi:signal peptidase I